MDNCIYKPRSFFDSGVERQCYIILQELINTEFYTVVPHMHLKDIFNIKEEKSIFWRHYHVDFAILKKLLVSNLAQLSNKTSYPSYCWHCGRTLSQKFRNDDPSIRFFACTNKDCKCRTLSDDKIHEIIKCNI